MRFVLPAAALMLVAVQAVAQTTAPITATPLTPPGQTAPAPAAPAPAAPAPATPAPATPAPATPAPAAAAPAAPAPAAAKPAAAKPAAKKHTQSLQQRFDAANVSHDGQLTKDQATAAKWGYVTSHFSSIDKGHKGYVTVDDIRAYAKARRAAKAKAAAPAN